MTRRIYKQTSRKDFLTRILENRDPILVSDIQLAAHASDFVLAGSETSSTCLCTITYYLLKTPSVARKLQKEVRGAFKSYSDINAASTTSLRYMHAVILEALRIYPPLPFALPRVVPEGGDTVDGHFLPSGASTSSAPLRPLYLCETCRLWYRLTPLLQALIRPTSRIRFLLNPKDGSLRMGRIH